MPDDVKRRLADIGGFRSAVESLVPSLNGAATAMRSSTSSGVYRTDTGAELPGSSGIHLYVWVADVSDSERFLKALHARAWLAGLGWYFVGAAGQLLERSIVDRMVGQPERLVFEGAPVLESPLAQNQRRCAVTSGGMLDTLSACPVLDAAELARFDQLKATARHALRGASEKASREFVVHKTDVLTKRGIAPAAACKVALSWSRGTLLPAVVLEFDDPELVGITVGDVLADPEQFVGETLADPLEGVDYGRCKSMIMRRADGSLFIHTFAHGRGLYELRPDVAFVQDALRDLAGAQLVEAFARMLSGTRLDAVEEDELIKWASETAEIGKMVVKRQLKDSRTAAAQTRAQTDADRELAERTDPRPQRYAPFANAPWLAEMAAYDAILGASLAEIPPTRHIEDELNCVRRTVVPGTHAFGSDDKDDTPAPQWNICKLDNCETANLLEKHIDFIDFRERYSVRCPGDYVNHYRQWHGSTLPKLVAISPLPLVLGNGEILCPRGLDRLRGIAFNIDDEIRECLPTERVRDRARVAVAFDFLLNDWLADVSCSFTDKCVALALPLTLIERSLLPSRPLWFITAPVAESGKTTLAKMLITVYTGIDAVASAWSLNEDERRKALLAYFDAGLAYILWDNLLDGIIIQCPHVERSCTAKYYGDRKLGVSEHISASASTIHVFTVNNGETCGAMASRTLSVRIDTELVDPMVREFMHNDPVAWTKTNRSKILGELYTILLGNPMLDVTGEMPAKIRFPDWHRLVGAAIEHAVECYREFYPSDGKAAGVEFERLFKKQKSSEAEGVDLTETLDALDMGMRMWFDRGSSRQAAA
jgi:hypothetical protein